MLASPILNQLKYACKKNKKFETLKAKETEKLLFL